MATARLRCRAVSAVPHNTEWHWLYYNTPEPNAGAAAAAAAAATTTAAAAAKRLHLSCRDHSESASVSLISPRSVTLPGQSQGARPRSTSSPTASTSGLSNSTTSSPAVHLTPMQVQLSAADGDRDITVSLKDSALHSPVYIQPGRYTQDLFGYNPTSEVSVFLKPCTPKRYRAT